MQAEHVFQDFISDILNVVIMVFIAGIFVLPALMLMIVIYESATAKEEKIWLRLVSLLVTIMLGFFIYYISTKLYPLLSSYLSRHGSIERVLHSPLLTATLCLVLGIFAYALRCRARAAYAIWEIIIGVIVSYHGSFYRELNFLSFLGGLYIIVRGMDNLYKCISDEPELRAGWKRIFGDDT